MELLPDKLPKQQNFFLYRQQSAERMYNPTTTQQCKNENEGESTWKKVEPRQIHTSQCRQQTRQRLQNSEEPQTEQEINFQHLYEAQFDNPSFKGQLKYLPIKKKEQQFCLLANSSEELQQQFQQAMKTQQAFYNQANITKLKKELHNKDLTMQQLIQRKKKQRALKLQQDLKEKRQNEEQKDWERPKYLTKNNAKRYFLKSASVSKFDSKLVPIKKMKQIPEKPELNIQKKQFLLTANDQNNQFLQQQIINQNNERKTRQSGEDFSPKKSYKRQISSNVLSYLDTKIWTNIKQ